VSLLGQRGNAEIGIVEFLGIKAKPRPDLRPTGVPNTSNRALTQWELLLHVMLEASVQLGIDIGSRSVSSGISRFRGGLC